MASAQAAVLNAVREPLPDDVRDDTGPSWHELWALVHRSLRLTRRARSPCP